MTPCLRRISFLESFSYELKNLELVEYHSVSAFGSSIGTLMRSSIGAAIFKKWSCASHVPSHKAASSRQPAEVQTEQTALLGNIYHVTHIAYAKCLIFR